tara:strand:- start:109 stop:408 length:300 start_codon:yes stop_codon:yes gene_type:complete
MKITKQQLKQIIREELARTISETDASAGHDAVINDKLNEAMQSFRTAREAAMEMYKLGDDGGFKVIKGWLGALNDAMQGHAQHQDATQSSSDREELEGP